MTFDAMAAAVDWLDAYRAGDIETLLDMYQDDAVTECSCDRLTIVGQDGLRAYWERRLRQHPASDLDDLKPSDDGATVCYVTPEGLVSAVLQFAADGRIAAVRCGSAQASSAGSRA